MFTESSSCKEAGQEEIGLPIYLQRHVDRKAIWMESPRLRHGEGGLISAMLKEHSPACLKAMTPKEYPPASLRAMMSKGVLPNKPEGDDA